MHCNYSYHPSDHGSALSNGQVDAEDQALSLRALEDRRRPGLERIDFLLTHLLGIDEQVDVRVLRGVAPDRSIDPGGLGVVLGREHAHHCELQPWHLALGQAISVDRLPGVLPGVEPGNLRDQGPRRVESEPGQDGAGGLWSERTVFWSARIDR